MPDINRFEEAIQKMANISLQYVKGTIKYVPYSEQMDALMDASGWTKDQFQKEIDRRKDNFRR